MTKKITRALISVYDKTGLVELGKSLDSAGVEILSTGSTAATLRDAGVKVIDVSTYTGFPEIMGGRVKRTFIFRGKERCVCSHLLSS